MNKGRASADTRLNAGDVVRCRRCACPSGLRKRPRPWRNWRPPGWPVSCAGQRFRFCLRTTVAGHQQTGRRGGTWRLGRQFWCHRAVAHGASARPFLELVHRLDRETSGILLVAKKRSALKNLQDQFRERETGQDLPGAGVGQWPANKKVLDKPLHKYLLPDGERRVKVVTKDDPDGMPSLTLVKVRALAVCLRMQRALNARFRCWK
jgi:23S rRNA pseudouridine955/2504/2580 synthase